MQTALVLGGGGFIGHHLVNRLTNEKYWVRAVDQNRPAYSASRASEFIEADLRDPSIVGDVFDRPFDEVYQLAADMGGAGYIFTGDNDADILNNSALINLNVLNAVRREKVGRILFASSACVYPKLNQLEPGSPDCRESTAYPAQPDSDYGWEKLFAERLYFASHRNFGLNVRIARYHNVFGPQCDWHSERAKAPAAICRKVAAANDGGVIEIWGDGAQTRSFLHIDECLEGSIRLMRGDWAGPVNIGSDQMVSINELAEMIMQISGKRLGVRHICGPQGVRGRTSDNTLIERQLGWRPTQPLRTGLAPTYRWVEDQVLSATE